MKKILLISGLAILAVLIFVGYAAASTTIDTNVNTGGTLTVTGTTTIDTTTLVVQASENRVGIGTASPSTTLHVLSTTEQLRLAYNDANYIQFTVSSGGDLTIAPSGADTSLTGTLAVSGNTTIGGTLTVTGAGAFSSTLTVTGILTAPYVVNTPQTVYASTTAASATAGNAISIGTQAVTIKGIAARTDAYVNLPNTTATGTSIILYNDTGVSIGLATASTTTGLLQKINNGTVGTGNPSATSTFPANYSMKCWLASSYNWNCIEYDAYGTASTTIGSALRN